LANIIAGLTISELIRGGGDNDIIYASGGDDTVFSGHGKDTVYGGAGDDIIYNDVGNDVFDGDGGTNTISFAYLNVGSSGDLPAYTGGVKFDLAKTTQTVGVFGTDTYLGFDNVTGSGGADKLFGNKFANVMMGQSGNDAFSARNGHDTIIGGYGADTMVGGAGSDKLGGYVLSAYYDDDKQDVYRYKLVTDSRPTVAGRDTIWGTFDGGVHGDKIDLHLIDADGDLKAGDGKFQFIGNLDFKADRIGEVQVLHLGDGEFYLVSVDTDGDNAAEMQIMVHSLTTLTAADFIL
jgi:Ca2+-binding RTX toxin-like protein